MTYMLCFSHLEFRLDGFSATYGGLVRERYSTHGVFSALV